LFDFNAIALSNMIRAILLLVWYLSMVAWVFFVTVKIGMFCIDMIESEGPNVYVSSEESGDSSEEDDDSSSEEDEDEEEEEEEE